MRYYIIDSGDGTQFKTLSEVRNHLYNMSENDRKAENGNILICMDKDIEMNLRRIIVTKTGKVTFSSLPDYYIR